MGGSFCQQIAEGWEGDIVLRSAGCSESSVCRAEMAGITQRLSVGVHAAEQVRNVSFCHLHLQSDLLSYILFFSNCMSGP